MWDLVLEEKEVAGVPCSLCTDPLPLSMRHDRPRTWSRTVEEKSIFDTLQIILPLNYFQINLYE